MKTKIILSGIFGVALLLGSCSTSNNVVSHGLIQKRKYNKGFFIKSKDHHKASDENLAKNEMKSSSDQNIEFKSADLSEVKEVKTSQIKKADMIASTQTSDVVVESSVNTSSNSVTKETKGNVSNILTSSQSEKRNSATRSQVREEIKQLRKLDKASGMDGFTVLLIILAIIIPPLAVLLYEGATGRFWIDLILALLGWGLAYWLLGPTIAFAGGLAAIIYALLIVLEVI